MLEAPTPAEIEAARGAIADYAIRTPLVRLNVEDAPAQIFLKLENLQPIGSFKVRGAANAFVNAPAAEVAPGVYTASAGNMAQGVGFVAGRAGVPFSVVVPDHAPHTKLAAIERLGGSVIKVPFDEWWEVMMAHGYQGMEGFFIHPVSDKAVIAGNGTIGLEILEDLPDVDTVVVPFGGGGLSTGIATALRSQRPDIEVLAAEVATAAPFAAALDAGKPVDIEYIPSFVDGIGASSVLPEMWPLTSRLLDGSLVSEVDEIAAAVRLLMERNRIVAEGAGAAAVAAAQRGAAGSGKVVCIVSGGNIDSSKLGEILSAA